MENLELNNIFFDNYNRDICNCRINALKDFEQESLTDENIILHFRFDHYLQIMETIYTNYVKCFSHFNIIMDEKYEELYKKEAILLNLWYSEILKKDKKEVLDNAFN